MPRNNMLPRRIWYVVKPDMKAGWKTRMIHSRAVLGAVLAWHKDVEIYKGRIIWETGEPVANPD